jgi:KipI family sensor histidine kinase inhibitor
MRPEYAGTVRFQPASDQSLLISFGDAISPESSERVLRLLRLLAAEPLPAVRNFHPAYTSLLINFDPLQTGHAELEAVLGNYLDRLDGVNLPPPTLVDIPVCYGGDFGPDLTGLAAKHGMTPEEVVSIHSAPTYSVSFLGFVPGFGYLSGLPATLVTPRLPAPRRGVPAGSVGIAGHQTGVYPCATPGGWQLIGRTPLQMFDAGRDPMSLLAIGDSVRFTPISRERFSELERR